MEIMDSVKFTPKELNLSNRVSLGEETKEGFYSIYHKERYKLETNLIKHFFYGAMRITFVWIGVLIIVVGFQIFSKYQLEKIQFITLFSTTTATIISLWGTSGYLLFKKSETNQSQSKLHKDHF